MRFYSLLLAILCQLFFTSLILAQRFRPGYIVRNGEKIEGGVHYEPTIENNTILFKPPSGDVEKLTSDQVKGFYLAPFDAEFISILADSAKKSIFVEVAVKGPASYSHYKKLHVLSVGDSTLQLNLPIGSRRYSNDDDFKKRMRAEGVALRKIKSFLPGCPLPSLNRALKGHIMESTLSKAAVEYNECKGLVTARKRYRLRFGITAGVNFVNTSFKYKPFDYLQGQPGLRAGLVFELKPAAYHSKTVFNFQVVYLQNKYSVKPGSPYATIDINPENSQLQLAMSVKLYLKAGQRGLFFSPGFSPFMAFDGTTDYDYIKINKVNVIGFVGLGWESIVGTHRIITSARYNKYAVSLFEPDDVTDNYQFDVSFLF